MQGIPPCSTVFIEALEGHANGLEGQFIPGDALFLEELGLDGFGAWVEGGGQQAGPVIKMNLPHPNDIDQREKPLQLDLGTGFFSGFAKGALLGCFAQLKKATWQRPQTKPGLDIATAEQHLRAPDGQGTDNRQGVLIMNGSAGRTTGPLAVIVLGDTVLNL